MIARAVSQAGALRRIEMPREEIRAVLSADDAEIVRRYLELHRERLEERLAERQRVLVALEGSLIDAILEKKTSRRHLSPLVAGRRPSSDAAALDGASARPAAPGRAGTSRR
jgi:hypothetical protein